MTDCLVLTAAHEAVRLTQRREAISRHRCNQAMHQIIGVGRLLCVHGAIVSPRVRRRLSERLIRVEVCHHTQPIKKESPDNQGCCRLDSFCIYRAVLVPSGPC